MSLNIYVGNLPYNIAESALKDLFSQFGTVTSVKVIMDAETGRSKGFGFVEMENNNEGQQAVQDLNGHELQGRMIKVSEARPKKSQWEDRPRGDRNFRPRSDRGQRSF